MTDEQKLQEARELFARAGGIALRDKKQKKNEKGKNAYYSQIAIDGWKVRREREKFLRSQTVDKSKSA